MAWPQVMTLILLMEEILLIHNWTFSKESDYTKVVRGSREVLEVVSSTYTWKLVFVQMINYSLQYGDLKKSFLSSPWWTLLPVSTIYNSTNVWGTARCQSISTSQFHFPLLNLILKSTFLNKLLAICHTHTYVTLGLDNSPMKSIECLTALVIYI